MKILEVILQYLLLITILFPKETIACYEDSDCFKHEQCYEEHDWTECLCLREGLADFIVDLYLCTKPRPTTVPPPTSPPPPDEGPKCQNDWECNGSVCLEVGSGPNCECRHKWYLRKYNSCPSPTDAKHDDGGSSDWLLWIIVILIIIMCLCCCGLMGLVYYKKKHRKKKPNEDQDTNQSNEPHSDGQLQRSPRATNAPNYPRQQYSNVPYNPQQNQGVPPVTSYYPYQDPTTALIASQYPQQYSNVPPPGQTHYSQQYPNTPPGPSYPQQYPNRPPGRSYYPQQ